MTVFEGWLLPQNPDPGDTWMRGTAATIGRITFIWDGNNWLPTTPSDAFAGLVIAGGSTAQHLAKAGVQAYNLRWVDASDGILFVFPQDSALNDWEINHNLRQRFVSVTVVDTVDTVIVPEIDFRTINTCILHFANPVQGTALIRR